MQNLRRKREEEYEKERKTCNKERVVGREEEWEGNK